ncbi:beta-lactamase-like protein [Lentinula aff. lateritia]|uniref:Beta-lactamase-like protein n=1 Tax=Lentinula aff. lateritia TaxID=2804960 RepID=A0ACC1TPF1_9AGAR|nr:beta-lactamase-like protein [Lentinula aff. lateritia]
MSNPSSLRIVDKLTITFLVDNHIEWHAFTRFPPGFTHELPQHLQEHHCAIDPVTDTPMADFDKFCCGAHGFSALIETEITGEPSRLILFDTGPDNISLVRNIGAMRVPLHKVERIITSHWHADHTGGLISFLQLRNEPNTNRPLAIAAKPCVADVHPNRPFARGIAPGPRYDKVIARLPPDPTFEQIKAAGATVEKHAEGHLVAGDMVWVSGEIPRVTSFETGLPGAKRFEQGVWTDELHIMDERYAAIDVAGKGLIIFSACSHAGIVNVVKDAIAKLSRPVYMIVGGLHLAGDSMAPRIQPTIEWLSKSLRPSPTYILPMHCSGFDAKVALEKAFGEGAVPAGVGIKVEIVADREHDKRLALPVIQE